MGDMTIYRTLSPERTPFLVGINHQSHFCKVPEKYATSLHILRDCEVMAYLQFCHLGTL
jgi:hypothetical protein